MYKILGKRFPNNNENIQYPEVALRVKSSRMLIKAGIGKCRIIKLVGEYAIGLIVRVSCGKNLIIRGEYQWYIK